MVWAVPRSLAATSGITICFLFLWVLRWFTSLRCLPSAYVFSGGSFGISQRGFPHSEIPGSKLICSSPGLIAAYRVLHRLLEPRHSPYTLSSLTIRNSDLFRIHLRGPLIRPYAHCVCVVGKNYRLQNIQLSKRANRPGRSVTTKRGGEYRARTGDLLVANQALSQLS